MKVNFGVGKPKYDLGEGNAVPLLQTPRQPNAGHSDWGFGPIPPPPTHVPTPHPMSLQKGRGVATVYVFLCNSITQFYPPSEKYIYLNGNGCPKGSGDLFLLN